MSIIGQESIFPKYSLFEVFKEYFQKLKRVKIFIVQEEKKKVHSDTMKIIGK